ncbi:MAG: transketolase family protein [Acidobacteria bacterium]|nr:transketolase family protein [Acidobacteriota bacterium]
MRRVFGDHLVQLGERYPELVVLDADVSSSTQTRLFADMYPQRFINCGIAEANMVSVAAGIAAAGLHPVASTFACLPATRALDQIRSQVAYPRLPVVLAGGYSGLSDFADGASHQSIEDLAVFAAMPNMTVLCPGDATETELALEAALQQHGPVYLRLSRAEVPRLPVPGRFALGKAIIRRDGSDVALLSTGQILECTLEAADLLEKEGIHPRVLDLHTLKPLDEQSVVQAAVDCGAIVTCEESSLIGGLGSLVAVLLARTRPTPMAIVGIADRFGQSGAYPDLRGEYGLSACHIRAAALELVRRKEW